MLNGWTQTTRAGHLRATWPPSGEEERGEGRGNQGLAMGRASGVCEGDSWLRSRVGRAKPIRDTGQGGRFRFVVPAFSPLGTINGSYSLCSPLRSSLGSSLAHLSRLNWCHHPHGASDKPPPFGLHLICLVRSREQPDRSLLPVRTLMQDAPALSPRPREQVNWS